ncbi:MAG: arginine decarboxylase [Thermomicrobiales bacterium]|nr:arginine decarboxylase [Thermomicrobiales bacterium]
MPISGPVSDHSSTASTDPCRGRGLRIEVVAAIGHGRTPVSSFDDGLRRCGVYNYNLLLLSSVIPPGSTVVPVDRCARPADEFGHRLYVVKAEARSDLPGAIVAAGVGWAQWDDDRGVFVEHALQTCGASPDAVRADLIDHLRTATADLCLGRDIPFDAARFQTRVSIGCVVAQPTTALVLAVYQSEGWQ